MPFSMGYLLHSPWHRSQGEPPMKNAHATDTVTTQIAEEKYFLIWIGLWIVALLALLPR
jgi:hypothetical protein